MMMMVIVMRGGATAAARTRIAALAKDALDEDLLRWLLSHQIVPQPAYGTRCRARYKRCIILVQQRTILVYGQAIDTALGIAAGYIVTRWRTTTNQIIQRELLPAIQSAQHLMRQWTNHGQI